MKLRVTKKWWQFWLPGELEVDWPLWHQGMPIAADKNPPVTPIKDLMPGVESTYGKAGVVEANEAQPWYSAEPHQPTGGQIVEAVPDIVAKSQGTQMMHDRMEHRR